MRIQQIFREENEITFGVFAGIKQVFSAIAVHTHNPDTSDNVMLKVFGDIIKRSPGTTIL